MKFAIIASVLAMASVASAKITCVYGSPVICKPPNMLAIGSEFVAEFTLT